VAPKKKESPKDAIVGLRSQLDMLEKRERHLQSQLKEQEAQVKKYATTNRDGKRVSWPLSIRHVRGIQTGNRRVTTARESTWAGNNIKNGNG
jgi:charged multivesicular body protein 4